MATKAELIKRHPALNYTGAANLTALHKASEVLDDLKAKRGTSLSHVWGYDPNVSNTEHHTGRAFDFMVFKDKAAGGHIANYLIQHKQRLGLIHVIWYQRIYRGPYSTSKNPKGVWQVMADRGNDTQNHKDHPHAWFADIPYVPLTPPTALSSFLERGSTGPEVALLQRMLNGMDKAGLSVDSSFGPAVEKAVKSAQSKRGLTADGKVGPATRSRLNADWKAYNTPTTTTTTTTRAATTTTTTLILPPTSPATPELQEVSDAIWKDTYVKRRGVYNPVIQELADIKTLLLEMKDKL